MRLVINKIILLLIPTFIFLHACDVDDGYEPNKYANIGMPQAQENPANRSIPIVDSAQTLIYSAAYRGANMPSTNIPVSFSINAALVDSFNANNGTSYPILPDDSYEFSKKKATISDTARSTDNLKIVINPAGHLKAQGTKYLLPLTMDVDMDTTKLSASVNKDLQTTYFLIQGSYVEINRMDWSVLDFDDQEQQNDAPPENILDGNNSTVWATEYRPNPKPAPPHFISFDMGKEHTLNGFRIIGRLDQDHSNPKDITIQFSDDGENWNDGESFTNIMTSGQTPKAKVYLSHSIKTRYFKLIITRNTDDRNNVHIAEIYAF